MGQVYAMKRAIVGGASRLQQTIPPASYFIISISKSVICEVMNGVCLTCIGTDNESLSLDAPIVRTRRKERNTGTERLKDGDSPLVLLSIR